MFLMPRRYQKVMHIKTHHFCTMGTEVRHLHFVSKEMFSNGLMRRGGGLLQAKPFSLLFGTSRVESHALQQCNYKTQIS